MPPVTRTARGRRPITTDRSSSTSRPLESTIRPRGGAGRSTGAATSEDDGPVVETDHFTVDLAAKQVTVDGAVVRLTPTEWALLAELVRAPGRLVGQRQLLQSVWGPAYVKER